MSDNKNIVIIDGPNGTGKTTLIDRLKLLPEFDVHSSPGGTELSKVLRPICRGLEIPDTCALARMYLFAATRHEEFDKIIKSNPKTVICDRWYTSSIVYQYVLEKFESKVFMPTITDEEINRTKIVYILDCPFEMCVERIRKREEADGTHGYDKWSGNIEKFKQVHSIYYNELPAVLWKLHIPFTVIKHEYPDDTDRIVNEIKQEHANG